MDARSWADPADEPAWAENEFGGAELNDPRRTRRLVAIATALAEHPTAPLPEAFPTDAERQGAYRFFQNDCVEPERLLAAHTRATWQLMAAEPVVLAVQDTTLLDASAHPATVGVGTVASARQQGMLVHSTLAITPDRVPLGVLAPQVWARDGATDAQLEPRRQRRLVDKESQKWAAQSGSRQPGATPVPADAGRQRRGPRSGCL